MLRSTTTVRCLWAARRDSSCQRLEQSRMGKIIKRLAGVMTAGCNLLIRCVHDAALEDIVDSLWC